MAKRWAPDRLDRERYPAPGLGLPVLFGDLDTNMHVNNVALAEVVAACRSTTGAVPWPQEARAALERLAGPTCL